MKTPKLPKGHIWEITERGDKIWKRLPEVVETAYWGCHPSSTTSHAKYTYREQLLSRTGRDIRRDTVRFYDRRKVVFEQEIDWADAEDPYSELEKVLKRWKRFRKVDFGLQGEGCCCGNNP